MLIGKTTTPEFGCKAETNSPLTGLTRNPWDPAKSPGGSSGGTAAAVAAGLGPLGVGTDGAGSVRIPAAFCGNVGLKPSFGRVPAYPLSPFGTVSHIGPHTMSVADAALMLNVLKQPDPRDWTSLPPDPSDLRVGLEDGVAGLRVAYSPTLGYARVDPEVAAAVDVAVGELASLGAVVEAVDPGFEDPLEITTGLWFTGAWTLWNTLTPEQQAVTDPDFAAQAELGAALSNLDVQRLQLRRGELGSLMRRFMTRYDLLVTPTVAVPAFDARPAGHTPDDARVDARVHAVLVPVQPDPAAGDHRAVRPDRSPSGSRRPTDRPPARRPDVRRRPRPAGRPRLRTASTRCPAHLWKRRF